MWITHPRPFMQFTFALFATFRSNFLPEGEANVPVSRPHILNRSSRKTPRALPSDDGWGLCFRGR